jgi:TIR domain-containing protein/SIR2-like protein
MALNVISFYTIGENINMADKNTERFWGQLLSFIEEGRVIPVIGPELLKLDVNGDMTLLYSYLAEQLASRLQINYKPTDTLNTIVCRYLSQEGQREDIYPELKRVMPQLTEIKLPEALIKLAEIRSLNLFVTTSFDPLLVYALNKIRYGGQEKTQVLAFSPGSNNDLPEALEQLDRATVFHLFGKLTAVPDYAVTDEDVLEFMHSLQSQIAQPNRLFDVLTRQNLIVIGCPLSDWLGRFFIRIAKKERLANSRGKTDFLAGDQLHNETELTEFFQHFSLRTKVFPLASIEFVDELHRRCKKLNLLSAVSKETRKQVIPCVDEIKTGSVFLSYANEDQPTVALIRDELEEAGIDVWFDRNPGDLRPGDNFEAKIKANINQCSLFIPVISQNTLIEKARFFRIEWKYAQKLAERYPDNKRFILPVAIDDTPIEESTIPEKFRELHWERIQGGKIHEALIREIKELYRDYQRIHSQPV